MIGNASLPDFTACSHDRSHNILVISNLPPNTDTHLKTINRTGRRVRTFTDSKFAASRRTVWRSLCVVFARNLVRTDCAARPTPEFADRSTCVSAQFSFSKIIVSSLPQPLRGQRKYPLYNGNNYNNTSSAGQIARLFMYDRRCRRRYIVGLFADLCHGGVRGGGGSGSNTPRINTRPRRRG